MEFAEILVQRYGHLVAGQNKTDLIGIIILLEALSTFAFVICSFVVSGTANAGFNCVLTGFLNIAYVGGSHYVIENSKSPIAVSDNSSVVARELMEKACCLFFRRTDPG